MSNTKPVLTWYVKDTEDSYTSVDSWYAGSCIPNQDFILEIQIWNNRWNTLNDVENITNAKLILSFENAEDSVLFQLCEVKINDGSYEKPAISSINKAVVTLGTIYGTKNAGTDSDTDNHKDISIKFSNVPSNFSEGLKSLFIDIDY